MSEYFVGDHIFFECGGYSHHGIYIGNDSVIHFDSTPGRKFLGSIKGQPPEISEVSLADFAGGKEIHVRQYLDSDILNPPEESIRMARSRIGEVGYHLYENNCEHFAVWCKTGKSHSSQVESACRVASTGVAGVAMGSAIVRSARYLPVPYRILAYGAGAAIAVGSTTYKYVVERKQNRIQKKS